MHNADAKRWNERFRNGNVMRRSKGPDTLLKKYDYLLPATGLALDAASGEGRHGLFLAQHGMRVIALDVSYVALKTANSRFLNEGYTLDTGVVDLTKPWLPPHSFDVILNFNFLERATIPVYLQALKPGGLLFFATFVRNAKRNNPDHYLLPGELLNAFSALEIIHAGQRTVHRPDDFELPIELKDELVARKPSR